MQGWFYIFDDGGFLLVVIFDGVGFSLKERFLLCGGFGVLLGISDARGVFVVFKTILKFDAD